MEDLTGEVAYRLGVDPRVLAVVLGAPWRRAVPAGADRDGDAAGAGDPGGPGGPGHPGGPGGAVRDGDPAGVGDPGAPGGPGGPSGRDPAAAAGEEPRRGRVFVGVPSPSELRALDLPADGLRHFGLTPAHLRAGGWTDADLRTAGLTPPGADGPGRPETEWFVAGEPAQLMLGIPPAGAPRIARPEPRREAGVERVDPVDVEELPGLAGCTDPEAPVALAARELRDGVLRRARRALVHCPICLRQVHRAETGQGVCPACSATWLGVVD